MELSIMVAHTRRMEQLPTLDHAVEFAHRAVYRLCALYLFVHRLVSTLLQHNQYIYDAWYFNDQYYNYVLMMHSPNSYLARKSPQAAAATDRRISRVTRLR
jgi:hypothetical protein